MKRVPTLLLLLLLASVAGVHASYSLAPLASFGPSGDGSIKAGDGLPYLTTGNRQRGFTQNPVTGNVILVDRASGSNNGDDPSITGGIHVLDGITGAFPADPQFGSGLLNTNGMGGGDFGILAIGVAADGKIYAGNLVNNGTATPFKLYCWDGETSGNPPALVFDGDPGNGFGQRWGDTMDVRGSGADTQIILGSRTFQTLSGTRVALLTTLDGVTFTATTFQTDAGDNFGDGIAFGAGDTFWAKSLNRPLRHMSFDPGSHLATTIKRYDAGNFPGYETLGPIAVNVNQNLLAAHDVITGPDRIRLFDMSNPDNVILLDSQTLPNTGGTPNATPGFMSFGNGNLYAHILNHGVYAYSAASGPFEQVPEILMQPLSKGVVLGRQAHFGIQAMRATSYQWFHNESPIGNATNSTLILESVQVSDSGSYRVEAINAVGSASSETATLTVISENLHHLNYLWSIAPGSRGYMNLDTDGQGRTPFQRAVAYNALSNHVYIVSRTSATANLSVNVVEATTGEDLYQLKTTGISGGAIVLLGIVCSEDGSIYAANMANPAVSATNPFKVYRWADAHPDTEPALVFTGEPTGQGINLRWGDALTTRGGGGDTQLLLDENSGNYVCILRPADGTLTEFTGVDSWYVREAYPGTIGRTLQFGDGNTVWQQRKATGTPFPALKLEKSNFNHPAPPGSNPMLAESSHTSLPATSGPLGIDPAKNILAGINFATSFDIPDTLDLYEFSNPDQPVLLAQYNFPVNHRFNNNFVGQVVFAGDRLYAINGNNGILAFTVSPGAPPPPLILTHPQGKRIGQGLTTTLNAFTPEVVAYQWQKDGVDIPLATGASLVIADATTADSGNYRVIVSNDAGSTTSDDAAVTVLGPADAYTMSPLWALAPGGTNDFLTSTDGNGQPDNLQRGMAYNPVTDHVLVVSRTASQELKGIYIVDGQTGALVGTLDTNAVAIIEAPGNPTFILHKIGVADDGVIYAGNFGTFPNTTFRIYRWADESAPSTILFEGDPADGLLNEQWGTAFAVRGAGAGTQILLGCRQTIVVLFTTDDGINFTRTVIQTDAIAGDLSSGLAFGAGNTFWTKASDRPLKQFSFDVGAQTATTIASISAVELDPISPMAYDPGRNLIGGIAIIPGIDELRLFQPTSPVLAYLARGHFPVDRNNLNLMGSVAFSSDSIFALDTNNGLIAQRLIPPGTGAGPVLTIQRAGSNVMISWEGAGFILEGTPGLTSPSWTTVSHQAGNPNTATEDASSGNRFYRLTGQ